MKTLHDLLAGFRVDQATHDALVRRTALALRGTGFTDVCADLPDYTRPGRIRWQGTNEGHVPDVTGGPFIVEVETADSISSDHTKSQCELFSAFASQRGLTFAVVVPAGHSGEMTWQLALWRIDAMVWEF